MRTKILKVAKPKPTLTCSREHRLIKGEYKPHVFGTSTFREEDLFRADYYKEFVQGVSTERQTDFADLSLQVLAIQTGGVVLTGSSDVSGMLQLCFADADSWYEVAFDGAAAEQPNEYHHLEMRVDRSGLLARTRDGYCAQPAPR